MGAEMMALPAGRLREPEKLSDRADGFYFKTRSCYIYTGQRIEAEEE